LSFQQSDAQGSEQASKPRHPMANRTSFKPGQSGNPLGGAILKQRNEAQRRRHAELRAAVASEFPGELTTFEAVLVDQAADALERAERGGDNNRVRLVRLALQVMERIRQGRTEKAATKPALSAFDEYVQQKATP
jgi:hypothetical protein